MKKYLTHNVHGHAPTKPISPRYAILVMALLCGAFWAVLLMQFFG